MSTLRELTDMLADELQSCGHDIIAADVLDALASTGLTLVEDPIGDSFATYVEEISS